MASNWLPSKLVHFKLKCSHRSEGFLFISRLCEGSDWPDSVISYRNLLTQRVEEFFRKRPDYLSLGDVQEDQELRIQEVPGLDGSRTSLKVTEVWKTTPDIHIKNQSAI